MRKSIEFTTGDLEKLKATADEDLLKTFPGFKRAELRKLKRGESIEINIEEQVELDRSARNQKREASSTEKKNKILLEKVESLEKELAEAFKIKKAPELFQIRGADNTPEEAVAFMVASDWHVEEEVKAEAVNNLNHYDLDESKLRAERFFSNGAYLIKLAQKHSNIKKLVLPLLGDFITNSLRDENLENNLLLPGDALWRAKSYLVSGIRFLLRETDVEIVLPCHTGNHGRMTEKVHIATEGGNSLEKYMYRNLQEYFENEKRVTFLVADGGISYLKIFDKTVRFMHGHSFKSGGGVGGITIPIRKGIMQLNKSKWADLTIMGHFHQMIVMEDLIVNGSLIGWNSFAEWIKADYEPPRQVFFVMHAHGGGVKTLISPIWLDKGRHGKMPDMRVN